MATEQLAKQPDRHESLYLAAERNDIAQVALLLEQSADPDRAASRFGTTALMEAAKAGHAELCLLLLRAGADPLATNSFKEDALALARQAGRREVLAVLPGGTHDFSRLNSSKQACRLCERVVGVGRGGLWCARCRCCRACGLHEPCLAHQSTAAKRRSAAASPNLQRRSSPFASLPASPASSSSFSWGRPSSPATTSASAPPMRRYHASSSTDASSGDRVGLWSVDRRAGSGLGASEPLSPTRSSSPPGPAAPAARGQHLATLYADDVAAAAELHLRTLRGRETFPTLDEVLARPAQRALFVEHLRLCGEDGAQHLLLFRDAALRFASLHDAKQLPTAAAALVWQFVLDGAPSRVALPASCRDEIVGALERAAAAATDDGGPAAGDGEGAADSGGDANSVRGGAGWWRSLVAAQTGAGGGVWSEEEAPRAGGVNSRLFDAARAAVDERLAALFALFVKSNAILRAFDGRHGILPAERRLQRSITM